MGLALLASASACGVPAPAGHEQPEPFRYSLKFATNQYGFPERACSRAMCRELLHAIEGARHSLDFAIYGVRGQDHVIDALAAAAGRGVRVRGVVDAEDPACTDFAYSDTAALITALGPASVVCDGGAALGAIMHDKFFVFDERWVWTGSANISDTELGGEYSTNVAVLIDSPALARRYTRELEQMHGGRFHAQKTDAPAQLRAPLTFSDGSLVESYFSPSDHALDHAVLPLIERADESLEVTLFYLTSDAAADALIRAQARGVRVRVILDALGAASEYSSHGRLCARGVPVKIENFGGKSHGKWAVADAGSESSAAVVFGSMNWTNAGAARNDENTLYVQNARFAARFSEEFGRQWSLLEGVPPCTSLAAEGAESSRFTFGEDGVLRCQSGACCDGIDNDHDGRVDLQEEACGCSDGQDNDEDGYPDGEDYDCEPPR